MAGQRNSKPGARLWMKILGVAILSIIVTNIGIVLFYFDQVPTGRWLGAGTQGASIARKLRTPRDQPLTVDDASDHPQPSRGLPEGNHTDSVGASRDSMPDSLETPQNHVAASRSPQTRAKTSSRPHIHVDSLGGHPENDVTLGPRNHVNGDHSGVRVSRKNVSDDGRASAKTAEYHPAMNAESEGSSKNHRTKADSSRPLIVWWDAVEGLGEEDVHCGHHACHVSVDRHRWGQHHTMVMSFYGSSLSCHDLPVPRGEGDLWALFHDESPKNLDFLFSHRPVMQLFNYTATFRRPSHLPFPTQWLDDVRELTSTQYVVPVSTKSALRRTERLAPVVYVQSDCSVPSDRDHFVRLLQQHVPVDCYGACLHNRQFPNSTSLTFQGDMSAMTAEGFYRVLTQYKFAIAIENAVCPGYITEKLWRPLQLGVVPIVFGAPDIKEFLPSENCALVVDDFQSVEELARAILYYDSHDTQYSQLLHFKQTGITNPALQTHLQKRHGTSQYRAQIIDDYHCMLCEKLHEAISSLKSGRPIPPSVASQDHYGCPKPGQFNDKGQYMPEVTGHWHVPWTRSQAMACLMRQLIDNGTRLSLDTFEAQVRHTERNFEHVCLQYF